MTRTMRRDTYFMDRITDQSDSPKVPVVEDTLLKTNEVSADSVFPELTKHLRILQ